METRGRQGEFVFKGLLIGQSDSGKRMFVRHHGTGEKFNQLIDPKIEKVSSFPIYTSKGKVTFRMLDTEDKEKFGNTRQVYAGAQCAIVFFDVTSRITCYKIENCRFDIGTYCGDIPVVLCGFNQNLDPLKSHWPLTVAARTNWQYYEICPKKNHNMVSPFLWLAKALLGDPNLEIRTNAAVSPPMLSSDAEDIDKLEQDKNVPKHPVPECDEEGL